MNTRSKDGTTLSKAFLPNNDLSTVTLYDFAFHIQTNVFTLLSVASGIFFLISFLGLIYLQIILARDHKESQCKNNKRWFKWVVWGSMALTIAVAAGSQQAADALEWVGDNGMGRLDIKSGGTLLGLQWVIVTFSVFFALGSSWIYNGKVKYKPKKDINASQY
jgi:4-hydroxybenzoate polyprenyltransferase